MSKEISPLEALSWLIYGLTNNNYAKEELPLTMSRAREIIEAALEENEYLKTELLGLSQELKVKNKALEIIKEIFEIKIVIDENENDKSCGMVFLVGGKDLIWTIYETFDEEKIRELKLLKEVLQ